MKRTASALWSGDLKTGKGTLSTQSGILNATRYGFNSRFEDGPGTNPEELVGAAHAGCFSMAMSVGLAQHNLIAEKIETKATVTVDQSPAGLAVTAIHLDLVAKIPGIDAATFQAVATATKETCIISRLLNTTITLSARLED